MTIARAPLPTWADWQDAAESLGLRNRSGELAGPCPSCGGADRFHVRRSGRGGALVGCRGCIDGGGRGFGEVLQAAGFGPERPCEPFSRSGAGARTSRTPETALSAPCGAPERDSPADDARVRLARALWAATAPADDSPGRAYLAGRWAWPPVGTPEREWSGGHGTGGGVPNSMNPTPLPPSVRWLAAGAVAPDPAAKWYGLPDGACGALLFVWLTAAKLFTQDRPCNGIRPPAADGPVPSAVSMLAVSEAGERRVTWFGERRVKVRTVGSRTGAVFEARAGGPGEPVHAAEGEADALALALAPWTGPGRVLAVGGTAGMRRAAELPGTGPVVLHADGDRGGRGAVERSRHAIEGAGRTCRVEWYPVGTDPADVLAAWIGERAAIREVEGGATREDADRGAWTDLFSREDDR